MKGGISRRQFMKTIGIGFVGCGLVRVSVICEETGKAGERCCRNCRAVIVEGNPFSNRRYSGTYCPNCGIDLHQGIWHLDTALPGQTMRGNGKPTWRYAQVPFPNPRLIEKTMKPTVFFKDIVL
jgi:hypothetical protein